MSTQIDPEQVKRFLAENNAAQASSLEEDKPEQIAEAVSYDELKAAQKESEQEAKISKDNIEETRSKLFEPDKASLAHLSSWVHEQGDLKVEVEEIDKSYYLKALLNDSELQLDIALNKDIELRFRALSNFDFEVVFAALRKLSEAGEITGPSQYASKVQQAAVAMQLVSYTGKQQDCVRFEKPYPSLSEAADRLITFMREDMADWGWPKWQCIITALRIFETKLAICNENIRNGNFWNPAGTP